MNLLGLLYYSKKRFAEYPCLHRININRFFTIFQMKDYMISYLSEL